MRSSLRRTSLQRSSPQRQSSSSKRATPRRQPIRVVLPARGCPPGAIDAMQQAYLSVLRDVHEDLTAKYVQDAAVKGAWLQRAMGFVTRAVRTIQSSVDEDLRKVPVISKARLAGGEEFVQRFRTRNVNLIKSVAAEHVQRIDAVVRENEGLHVQGLQKKLQQTLEVSESKAKFWAVDQTLKLHADIVETKHTSLGIVEYVWETSQDGTVRDDHAKLQGKTFRYDSPPVTNASEVAKGRPPRHCNPGKDYRCRCHADPVLPKLGAQVASQQPAQQAAPLAPQQQSITALPPDALRAVQQFTEFESPAIRAAQTSGIETPQTKALAKAFALGPDAPNPVLYRGYSGLSAKQLQERLARDVVHFSGRTTSTSASLEQALRYTTGEMTGGYEENAILYEMRRLPIGQRSKALPVAEISASPEEREVLIQGHVRWRVVSRVRLRELPNSTAENPHYLWKVVLQELPVDALAAARK